MENHPKGTKIVPSWWEVGVIEVSTTEGKITVNNIV